MTTYSQEELNTIFFAARVLCDSEQDAINLLRSKFSELYRGEEKLEVSRALKHLINCFHEEFERDGAYEQVLSATEVNELTDFSRLDPDFRVFVVDKLFIHENLSSEEFGIAFEKNENKIQEFLKSKEEATFLRDWQREIVRPADSMVLKLIPLGIIFLGIMYLILRGTGLI